MPHLRRVDAKHLVDRIDFLRIDAEIADYEISCSIDFSRYRASVMCIETREMTEDRRTDFERWLAADSQWT